MSQTTSSPKTNLTAFTSTAPTTPTTTQPEWIQSALAIIQAGREAELQHRQTVTEMKAMAETLDMQAPFPATVMAVLALTRANRADVEGRRLVEGVLWGVIEELKS